jgi:hypothetical protein
MLRRLTLSFCATLLIAGLALADPEARVSYNSGVPQIQISGSYPQSRYTISRATSADGYFAPITSLKVLCAGPCYGTDYEAEPGRTYWYRFDLDLADGSAAHFGPYELQMSPTLVRSLSAGVVPNPSFGPCRLEFFIPGSPALAPVEARVVLHDLQGRRVRSLWQGNMTHGLTSLTWDGRDDLGRMVGAGQYFLRFSTPLGARVTRIARFR